MTALIFSIAVILIFLTVLITEPASPSSATPRRPLGLIRWLSSGNWPAKLGAALLVLGFGALLRYALIHIELPPQLKLAGGFVLAAALGFAAFLAGRDSSRRSLALALGGASFGVAYLTAYSAYALFGYVAELPALVLLAAVSVTAAVFAVTRNAVSVAILAMLGAFLAPAFALRDPGASIVLGYYFVASFAVLAMIMARGWRPLIHLSFLFTLAGSMFFGWTAQYYQPAQFTAVYPWALALVAVHLAMPIAEHRRDSRRWLRRADFAYVACLPLVALATALLIAPNRESLAWLLGAFGALWLLAAIARHHWTREGAAAHGGISALFVIAALATAFNDLPWELLGLAFSVAGLFVARHSPELAKYRGALAGAALLFGVLHMVASIFDATTTGTAFFSSQFAERLVAIALLATAARLCRGEDTTFESLLTFSAALWACAAFGFELARFDWIEWTLVTHALTIAAAFVVWALARRIRIDSRVVSALAIAIPLTAALVSAPQPISVNWLALVLAPSAALLLLMRSSNADPSVPSRILALIATPVSAAIWAGRLAEAAADDVVRIAAVALTGGALLALVCAARFGDASRAAAQMLAPMCAGLFAVTIVISTVFDIARTTWAVTLELTCLAGLIYMMPRRGTSDSKLELAIPASIVAGALIVQATLLRVLGPPGPLDITALFAMDMPALVSLMWASLGAAFTIWGRRILSRTAWFCGAILLVAAAVKVVLVDFGSLGQLSNILAIIAAGFMFMLVGWLAPIPPAAIKEASKPVLPAIDVSAPQAREPSATPAADSGGARAWIITLMILAGAALIPGFVSALVKFFVAALHG